MALSTSVESLAKQSGTTQSLHLVFGPDVYPKIQFSAVGGGNTAADQANYYAFAAACYNLYKGNDPQDFHYNGTLLDYGFWQENNQAANDEWPLSGTVPANRRHVVGSTSPSVVGQLQSRFGNGITDLSAVSFTTPMAAVTRFMNLCEDLNGLATRPVEANAATWQNIVDALLAIIKTDIDDFFIPATGLGLAHVCGIAPATLSGPISSLPSGTSIGITLTFGTTA